ncbi:MAG: ABC transporter permease [Hyphomicrobiales bacterium]|nr:ABC transporter permease [Hyphomicrobiales bacterium]
MRQPVLRVENVTRSFRLGEVEVQALRGVSLEVQPGELVAIMGSSGSGKSTLMSILGCLDRPSSGRYCFEGVDVAGLKEPQLAAIRSERIGFVFQSFNLLPRTSALENVALPLFYSVSERSGRARRLERARRALALLGLAGRERNTPSQLSGGEQQRVAISRALINAPSLLLADEPTGNLDTQTSHDLMATLRELNREQHVTIVVVTHESDIAAYADRVITMRDGRVLSDERREPEQASQATIETSPSAVGAALGRDVAAVVPQPVTFLAFAMMVVTAALQALGRNKMRSALTMLGVFIGVAALIAMVAVGQGANEAVRRQIESLGTNLLVVMPGTVMMGGVRGGFGSASTLTVADAEAIRREAAAVGDVSYLIRQSAQVQYAGKNWSTSIQGVSANYPPTTNWQVAAGRAIVPEDDEAAALVGLLGQTAYRQLFAGNENPIGARIQVKGMPLIVIGLLAPKGQTPFGMDQDDLVMIPFATAERKVLGVAVPSQQQVPINWAYPPPPNPYNLQRRLTGYVNQIYVQASSPEEVQPAIKQVTDILTRRHRVRPGEVSDFSVRNLSQIAETAESSSRIMALLLAAVASISLLVGGIGIMNILLVSVTERTREIGLRMAIGARRLHVLLQFLAESVLLSVTGGIAGILMGILSSKAISLALGWSMPIAAAAIGGGFLFSVVVGVFFGFYPARKAAHLDPMEALRYE